MSGSVFYETWRRNWQAMLYWGIGIAALGVVSVLVVPDSATLKQYGDLIKTMPSFILNMVGGADAVFAVSPEGFLGVSFYGWVLLIFAVYAVMAGLNVTAIEEDRGILDILLSMPIPRWRVVVEKLAAYTVIIVIMILISFVALWITIASTPIFTLSAGRLFESTINIIPGTLLMLTFTSLIATLVRRRNTAAALAATFVTASYFVDVIGRSAQVTNVLRTVSFYSYYDSTTVLQKGLVWGNFLGLCVVALLFFVGTVYFFQRRDVGV